MRRFLSSRQAWLAERSLGIGASDAAAVLGVSPWHSPLSLFYTKRGEAPENQGQEFARRLGLELEDPIARLWSGETKRNYLRPAIGTFWLDQHATKPYMLASIDGECAHTPNDSTLTDVLEIKTAAISKASIWQDEPPIDYIVQVQHQLAVTGKQFATIAALIGGVQLRYADIERDDEFIAMLEAACEEFWRRVELNDPPPPDGSDATREFLKKLYPIATPSSVELPPEAIEWDQERMRLKDEIKNLEAKEQLLENQLKAAIGEHAQGTLRNGIVFTLKETKRASYTVKETTYRTLRRVAPKGERKAAAAKPLAERDLSAEFQEERAAETADSDEPWA